MQSSNNNNEATEPMDVDPIDDGPSSKSPPPIPQYGRSSSYNNTMAAIVDYQTDRPVTEEEAARCLDSLRSPDMAHRVAAAHRLDAVAAVLGPERTRSVSLCFVFCCYYAHCVLVVL